MNKRSAGILLFRRASLDIEVFLVHPGGPYWARKDLGSWSLPKGEYTDEEDPLTAARREFAEETSITIDGTFLPLGELKQPNGKIITAWALEHDLDPAAMKSNTFPLEWPPKSGKIQEFREVDAGAWYHVSVALEKLTKGQGEFVRRLAFQLAVTVPAAPQPEDPPAGVA